MLGEQGMVDEAQKVMEEAEALKKVDIVMYTDYIVSILSQPSTGLISSLSIAGSINDNSYFFKTLAFCLFFCGCVDHD